MSESIKNYLQKIKLKDITSLVFIVLLLFVVIKLITGGILGFSLVVIENGPKSSMWPTYDMGDMFLIHKAKPANIDLGDVIVYRTDVNPFLPDNEKMLIIHRVINVTILENSGEKEYFFRVSGDNPSSNNYVDSYNSTTTLIPYDAVLGKTIFLIPKIGYIRLFLSSNPVFQYLFIGLLIAILLYLIFAPEEDEKKTKEKEHKNSANQKEEKSDKPETANEPVHKEKSFLGKIIDYCKHSFIGVKKSVREMISNPKKRLKLIIYVSIITLVIVAIPVIDALIKNGNLETGINDIQLVKVDTYTDENMYFMAYRISFQHDGSWNKVMKDFTSVISQNGENISTMKWKSFYQKEGDLTIGGSFIIPNSSINFNSSFTITISYDVQLRFGKGWSDFYQESFTYVA